MSNNLFFLSLADIFSVYPQIFDEIVSRRANVAKIYLPSDIDWQDKMYYMLLEVQKTVNEALGSGQNYDEVMRHKEKPIFDTSHIQRFSPNSSPQNGMLSEQKKKCRQTISKSKAKINVYWSLDDISKAARLLKKPPEIVTFSNEHEMRKVYSLIYDVFRYKAVLRNALNDIRFYKNHPQFAADENRVWLMLYELHERSFQQRNADETRQEIVVYKEAKVKELSDCLWKCRRKLAASVSRMRIKYGALQLSNLLPIHLQNEKVAIAATNPIITGWMNPFLVRFVRNFQISKEIILQLLKMLDGKWPTSFRSTAIRPDIKLGTFLRFVATGIYQQTVGNECVSSTAQTSAGRIIRECLELFEKWICPQWIKLPLPEEQATIMEAFFDSSGFPGIIGCVDGTHIRIKCPGDDLKHLYYNRKAYYSINAMADCDHKMRIRYVDARYPGANHDAFIWEHGALDQKLQNEFDNGKRNTWILGDGGYKLKPYLMTPFRQPNDAAERLYNKKHIRARNVVERCFDVLKNRFRCIIGSRGLHYKPERATQIINACCSLHNMCIHYKCCDDPVVTSEVPQENLSNDDVQEDVVEPRAAAIRRGIAINL